MALIHMNATSKFRLIATLHRQARARGVPVLVVVVFEVIG